MKQLVATLPFCRGMLLNQRRIELWTTVLN
ncbi:hypothetical protein EC9_02400 [Rosistilla ulvae]|uniref:Uncharacterized protein n=1 Tax=Rosistilla ulvae TaxID=1930277 RepID=A0A517LTY6_9BACT|nr:hypothetical protein EC9_02400 [Rosistilla ulvae]